LPASRQGVEAKTIERDYALTHLVALIARHDADRSLVLEGGTSLRLLHSNTTDIPPISPVRSSARRTNVPSRCFAMRSRAVVTRRSYLDLSGDALVANTELTRRRSREGAIGIMSRF
jgi:hypothetical protein